MQNAEPRGPDIAIYRLSEGFILDAQGYTVALTNAADLAARVEDIAGKGEVGLSVAEPAPAPTPQPVTPELREATNVPSALAPTTASLETQWNNVRQLIAFMAAGFDTNGKAFGRREFDAALPMFAPNVDPKEAEFELSEFLAGLHDDE